MKIDFTQHSDPQYALQLSQWRRNSEAEAEQLAPGSANQAVDAEYELTESPLEVIFGNGYSVTQNIRVAKATVGSDGKLKSLRLNSPWATPESVATIVSKLAKDWNLVAFDPASADDDTPKEQNAIETLQKWVLNPNDNLPAYVAQTKTKPSAEIVLLRLMILPQLADDPGQFCVSIQAFWELEESQAEQDDPGFSDRINEVVQLANKQAESTPVNQVTDSLVYAAARYAAFAHWSAFQDPAAFEQSKTEFVENCVKAFEAMLSENLDEHQEMFD